MTRQPYSMRFASSTPVAMPSVTTTDLIDNYQFTRPQVTAMHSKQSPPSSIRHQQQLINVQTATTKSSSTTTSSSTQNIIQSPPILIKQQELNTSMTVTSPIQCSPTKSITDSISSDHGSSDFAASIQAALQHQQTPITISISSPPASPTPSLDP